MDESGDNGRVTLAVIAAKLDALTTMVRDMRDTTQKDHDRLGKVESDLEDFVQLKSTILRYGVMLILTMGIALYAVLQHTFKLP